MECTEQEIMQNININSCSNVAIHILLKQLDKGLNLVFSPVSFQLMLGLIAVGSKGSTLDQLLSFLGLKSINELTFLASQLHTSLLSSTNETHQDLKRGPIVSFVNGCWVDQRFGLKPSFAQLLKGLYHSGAEEVDFANMADQVIKEVNSWAETATKGLIQNLLPQESLSSDTALAAWDRKFDPSKTEHKEFYLLNGQTVEVPFMTSKPYEKHLYRSFDGYKVVKIPYQNRQDNTTKFSMCFFLPDVRDGLHSLIQIFKSNPELYSKQLELREEDVPKFWIPRFKFSFKFEASESLKELGLELPFSDMGDFTEMVDSPEKIVLSKIFHGSSIEVNEEGTEAAASTAPRFRKCCGRMNPPSFVADHPFIFMIKEEISGIVFFIGAVLDPFLVS